MKPAAALLLCTVALPAWTQAPAPVSEPVADFSLEASSFIDALLKVSARFRFPLGVEWVKSPDTLKPVRVSQSRITATEAIEAVVAMHPGYGWRREGAVVHVFQRHLVKDTRNPLNLSVNFGDPRPQSVGWTNLILYELLDQKMRHNSGGGIGGSVLGYPGETRQKPWKSNRALRAAKSDLPRSPLPPDTITTCRNH
jgi:hypothetical protein